MGRKRAYMSGFRPVGSGGRRLCDGGGGCGGEGVAEVGAGGGLLVVGAVSPREMRVRGGQAGGCGCRVDPAGGVPLGGAAGDRRAGFVEARRGAEVEAGEEARHGPSFGGMTGGVQGKRRRCGVARPDVRPAVPSPGGYGAGRPRRQCVDRQQRPRGTSTAPGTAPRPRAAAIARASGDRPQPPSGSTRSTPERRPPPRRRRRAGQLDPPCKVGRAVPPVVRARSEPRPRHRPRVQGPRDGLEPGRGQRANRRPQRPPSSPAPRRTAPPSAPRSSRPYTSG